MGRDETVQFEQDGLGNERRKLDEIRASAGGNAAGENNGLIVVTDEDVDTELVLYEPPSDVDEYYLTGVRAYNEDAEGGNFHVLEAELDADGNIASSDRRTVNLDMAADVTRNFGYDGDAFEDVIAISSSFSGQVSVSVLLDHKEHNEPASENY